MFFKPQILENRTSKHKKKNNFLYQFFEIFPMVWFIFAYEQFKKIVFLRYKEFLRELPSFGPKIKFAMGGI